MIAFQYRGFMALFLVGLISAVANAQRPPVSQEFPFDKNELTFDVKAMLTAHKFTQDGKTLVTISNDNSLRIWNAHTGALQGEAKLGTPNTQYHWKIFELPDAKRILTVGTTGKASVIQLADGKVSHDFPVPVNNYPHSYALLEKGTTLVRLDRTLTFVHYDVETGKVKENAKVPTPPADPKLNLNVQITLAPDAQSYVIHKGDCTLYDANTHKSKFSVPLDPQKSFYFRNGYYPAKYSADSKLVAIPSTDSSIRIVDVETGKEIRKLEFPTNPREGFKMMAPVAFSPNGKWMLVGVEGIFGPLKLYGTTSGLELRTFPGVSMAPSLNQVSFSEDSRSLIMPGTYPNAVIRDVFTTESRRKPTSDK